MANYSGEGEIEKSSIDKIINEKIEKFLANENILKSEKVKMWSDGIIRDCLRELTKLQKPYKYIANCTINQRCGNALYQHVSSYADSKKDIVTTVHLKNDILHCIVTVYALKVK